MTTDDVQQTPQTPYEIERAEISKPHSARLRTMAIVQGLVFAAIILYTTFADQPDLLLPLLIPVAVLFAVILLAMTRSHKKALEQLESDHGVH